MTEVSNRSERWFTGGGEAGAQLRSINWSQTSLGAVETWSLSLKTTLSVLLDADTPMFLLWGDDRVLFYNDAYRLILQQSNQLLLIGQSGQGIGPGDWKKVQADINQVFATGQPVQRKSQLGTSDRSLVHGLIWSYRAIWNEADQIGGVLATGYKGSYTESISAEASHSTPNISTCEVELQHAEAAIWERGTRLWLALKAAKMGTWEVDLHTGSMQFDQTLNQIFGIPLGASPPLRNEWYRCLHPDDRDRVQGLFQQAVAGETEYDVEYRTTGIDGSLCWLISRGHIIRDQAGQPLRAIGVAADITDRKQAEAALRESEELKQRILESSNDCIKVLTLAGEILYINAGGQSLLEIDDPTLVLNTNWIDFWHGVDREQAKTAIAAAKAGNISQFQGVCPTRRGTTKWWDSVISPVRDASGWVTQLVVISRDITQQKQMEVVLRESEARFRNMANHAPGMIWVTDSAGCCTYLSQSWYDFTGQTEATGLGWGWVNAVCPEDYERTKNIFLKANEQREAFRVEYRLRHQDGEYRWAIAAASPWFGVDGQFKGYIGSVFDITERKQTEAALQQSEERYRYLAELIPQLVWTANAVGILLDVNQRWSDFTGLTLAQAQLQGWEAAVHPDDIALLNKQWALAQQNGTSYQAEGRMRRADGVYRWHLHQAVPMKNEQGQVIKWFGTATDIEEQKQLEQQREHFVEQSLRMLQREQAARSAAEQANRIKDEFLAVLSHELRSPLNPILGWSQLLLNKKLDDSKIEQALTVIARNAKLQSELIEDLLDVSRILQGKLTLNRCPVDLVTTIQAAMETVRLAAEAKSIQIQPLFEPGVDEVLGDSARLQQVIWNLLSNAVKFTPNGGQVLIQLQQVGTEVQIRVQDTGKGISSAFLPHVFEYFRQEDSKTTRKFGGLGLGLAIVHHLTELHGGTVEVESLGEGKGATFTVKLPALKREVAQEQQGQQEEECDQEEQCATPSPDSPLRGLRVLVVDDEVDMQKLMLTILEQAGAEVRTAASAPEALTVLHPFKPDILISDIGMPEVDGYSLIKQIRALSPEQGGNILAVAFTAYAAELDQQQAMAAGFQQHIAKPVEPDWVVKLLADLIQETHGSSNGSNSSDTTQNRSFNKMEEREGCE